jgi:orotate phosphoribosyltransferase
MVSLIPSPDSIMQILQRTGAFREGHFVYPDGRHTPNYFQMPLAFRYYDTARVLAVALSRKFRLDRDISSRLPKVSVISPSPGGIPVHGGDATRFKRATDLLGRTGRWQTHAAST